MLGDGGVVDARGEENGNLEIGGGGNVDLVETDAVFGNHFEAGQGFLDDRAGEGIVTTKIGIELAGELEHAALGKWPAFADDLESGLGQHVVMDARSVLE